MNSSYLWNQLTVLDKSILKQIISEIKYFSPQIHKFSEFVRVIAHMTLRIPGFTNYFEGEIRDILLGFGDTMNLNAKSDDQFVITQIYIYIGLILSFVNWNIRDYNSNIGTKIKTLILYLWVIYIYIYII